MGIEQSKQLSPEERVIKLGKDDTSGEDSIYDLAKAEDKYHDSWRRDKLPKDLENKYADEHSTQVLEKMEAGKEKMADGLTGLRNRRALDEEIPQMLGLVRNVRRNTAEAERRIRHCSVLMLDLDNFKKINDAQGHLKGDDILRGLADIIKDNIRKGLDGAYRYGGEEFVIFLPNVSVEMAKERAEKISEKVKKTLGITVSVGISWTGNIPNWETAPQELDMEDAGTDLIGQADDAMYFSKGTGKDKITPYDNKVMEYKIISDLWTESEKNSVIKQLNENKSSQEVTGQKIIGNIPNIGETFKEHAMSCGCSDGRIQEHRIGRPGQGILAGVEATARGIVEYIKKLKKDGKIKKGDTFEIPSHAGCGAAELYFKRLKDKKPDDTPEKLLLKFTEDVREAVSKEFPEIYFPSRHIEAGEMKDIHNERAIYFDGTEKINIKAVSELPDGFTFTHMPEIDRRKTEEELEALCGIALGHHGFGERFTKEKPFWIIISAKDEEQLGELRGIAESVAKKFEGRVEVDGFIVKD